MILEWLGLTSHKQNKAQLTAIYVADGAGKPMKSVASVEATSDRGLEGDRYYRKTGYWDPIESCQVTLISEHDLKLAKRGNTLNLDNGSHRRNLVIAGLKTKASEGKTFRIGHATFSYEKPRPPCGYLNKIEGRGMAKALSYNSGICIRVLCSGRLDIGDAIEIFD